MFIFASYLLGQAAAKEYSNQLFYSYADATAACGGRVCAASGLASNMPGYYCDQYRAINPATHQQAVCQGGSGTWTKTVAAPSNCDFVDKWSCWNTGNNCWNTLSSQCTQACTCWNGNKLGASPLKARLGASNGKSAETFRASSQRNNVYCPDWLPQAVNQLSPDAIGYSCSQPNAFCAYPAFGMNFVCSPRSGVWKLQGVAPTPKPTHPSNKCPHSRNIWDGKRCYSKNQFCAYYNGNYVCANGRWQLQGNPPAPTPKPTRPTNECPAWNNIWNGKRCYSNNLFCAYYTGNYVCANGCWELQGNPPAPTPAPTNDATCPPADYPPKDGNYCTTTGQMCKYSSGSFKCSDNGVWKLLLL